MKCFRRLTRSFASLSVALLLWTAPLYSAVASPFAAGGTETEVSPTAAIESAIQAAVHARVGQAVTVSVQRVSGVRVARAFTSLVAVPDPAGRIGAPLRFVLAEGTPGRARLGEATATVQVTGPAVRALRAIARGARLDAEDVAVRDTDLTGRGLHPLLSLEDALGARARHDIVEDALLTTADVAPEPMVKAGEIVRAHVHVGDVEMVGSVVAAESGLKDELIRVVNPESRHAFRARITGSGEVEVVNVR
jgi:flagella basal body P-ring formation protein FlgA